MTAAQKRWKRPESVPFPRVWKTFEGRKPMPDGRIPKFRVEDVTEDMHEDILVFLRKYFHRHDGSPFWKYFKLTEDPLSWQEYRDRVKRALDYNISVVVFEEGVQEDGKPMIAGCNVHGIGYKNSPDPPAVYKSSRLRAAQYSIDYACTVVNVFEKYGVDIFMNAMGLLVHPAYRGQGLGEEILKARIAIGKSVGLKMTLTVFNGFAAQRLGDKMGMERLAELPYRFFKFEDGSDIFPENLECKNMVVVAGTF